MEHIQFNWLRTTVRLCNSLIHCNSPFLQEAIHADVDHSSRNPSCWISHLLFAMNGSPHAHGFQHKICSAKPLDLSQLLVELRSQHLANWLHFSAHHPRDQNRKIIHISSLVRSPNQECACYVFPLCSTQLSVPGFAQAHRAQCGPISPSCPHTVALKF
eukprot:1136811-Pelagomonas_calceolata.AAC.3